jgi:HEAT repeat protein
MVRVAVTALLLGWGLSQAPAAVPEPPKGEPKKPGSEKLPPPRVVPPLELKLTARRTDYALDPQQPMLSDLGGHPHPAAVVLDLELRNTGTDSFEVVAPPEPEWELSGPKISAVVKAGRHFFYVAQTTRFTLDAGESKHFVIRNLGYRINTEAWAVGWTMPGKYTLTGTWRLALRPAPESSDTPDGRQLWQRALDPGPPPFGLVSLSTAPIELRVARGAELGYWTAALFDPDEEVRLTAALTLKGSREAAAGAIAELTRALHDRNPAVRRTAAEALGPLDEKGAAAGPALTGLIADRVAGVRAAAAAALAHVAPRDKKAAHAIVRMLKDPDAGVRRAAAEALGQMAYTGLPTDPAVVSGLRDALRDGELMVRERAVWALGYVRHPDTVPDLVGLLRAEHKDLRSSALHSLGMLGSMAKAAVPEMVEVLRSDPENREITAWSLARMGPAAAPAVPALIECLDEAREGIRNQAARTLRDIGPAAAEAVEPLATLLTHDKDWGVRCYAAEALGAIGPAAKAAAPELKLALKDPMVQVRNAAGEALQKIQAK